MFEIFLLIGVLVAGSSTGGPLLVLAAMAVLDVPAGSHQVATDFIDGGGWVLLVVLGLMALGVALYALSRDKAVAASDVGAGHE